MTIKEQLREAIQEKGRLDQAGIEELGKRFGLNGHDLAKNLDQLGKEGHISVRWTAGRMVRLQLKGHTRANSATSRVYNWLAGRDVMGSWIEVRPRQIGAALGMGDNVANVAVSDLLRQSRIEVRRAANGRFIEALRIPLGQRAPLVVVDEKTGSTSVIEDGSSNGASHQLPPPERAPEVIPATPHLDAYLSARRIARLAPTNNRFLTVEFNEDPLAEEALVLRERLATALQRRTT